MATEREKESKFFAFNKKKPMKFTIMQGNMLRIKCSQYSKMITNHGGIVIDYEEKDDECIVLAHRKQPSTKPEMYDICYIKDCISQNKVLNFLDYRISSDPKYTTVAKKARREVVNNLVENNPSKGACAFAEKVLMNKQCTHCTNRSAGSILKIIQEKYFP